MPSIDDIWASMKQDSRPSPKPFSQKATWENLGTLSQSAGMASSDTGKVVETAELKMSIVDAKHIPGMHCAFAVYVFALGS